LAALEQLARTPSLNHSCRLAAAARPFRGSARRRRPGVFTSLCDFTLSFICYRLLHSSALLPTPRQHHELARVRSFIVVLGSNSKLHLRFKKSMNRAGTTVRVEPLVSPSADNSPCRTYTSVAPPKDGSNRAYSRPRLCDRGVKIQSVRCPRSRS
jgi:hypothetical protein